MPWYGQIIMWLLGVIEAAMIILMGWMARQLVNHEGRISVSEAGIRAVEKHCAETHKELTDRLKLLDRVAIDVAFIRGKMSDGREEDA